MRSKVLSGLVLAWAVFAAGPVAGDDGAERRAPVQVAQTSLPSFGGPAPAPTPPTPTVQAKDPGAAEEPTLGPKPPMSERPEWWWTDPLCRPQWRKLGNCRFDRRQPSEPLENRRESDGR